MVSIRIRAVHSPSGSLQPATLLAPAAIPKLTAAISGANGPRHRRCCLLRVPRVHVSHLHQCCDLLLNVGNGGACVCYPFSPQCQGLLTASLRQQRRSAFRLRLQDALSKALLTLILDGALTTFVKRHPRKPSDGILARSGRLSAEVHKASEKMNMPASVMIQASDLHHDLPR